MLHLFGPLTPAQTRQYALREMRDPSWASAIIKILQMAADNTIFDSGAEFSLNVDRMKVAGVAREIEWRDDQTGCIKKEVEINTAAKGAVETWEPYEKVRAERQAGRDRKYTVNVVVNNLQMLACGFGKDSFFIKDSKSLNAVHAEKIFQAGGVEVLIQLLKKEEQDPSIVDRTVELLRLLDNALPAEHAAKASIAEALAVNVESATAAKSEGSLVGSLSGTRSSFYNESMEQGVFAVMDVTRPSNNL